MWRPWRSCWWSPPPAFLHPRQTKWHGRLDRSFGYFCHFSLFDRFMQYFLNTFCQFAFFQDCHRTDAPLVSSSLVVLELTPGWPQESWASFHPAAARHYPDSTSAWAWSKLVSDVTIWGLGGDEDVRHICAEYVALFLSASPLMRRRNDTLPGHLHARVTPYWAGAGLHTYMLSIIEQYYNIINRILDTFLSLL